MRSSPQPARASASCRSCPTGCWRRCGRARDEEVPMNRRGFLARGLTLGATLAAGSAGAQTPAPDDPSKVLGGPRRPYGTRARFETAARKAFRGKTDEVGSTMTPLADLHGIITPSALHFEVQRGGVPDIDPAKHRLLVHGMVDRPVILTVDEIKRLPSVSRIYFLECS